MKIELLCPFEILPNAENVGDNIVELGGIFLLERAGHDVYTNHYRKNNFDRYYAPELVPECDATILVGTPWFWDGCEKSEKYEDLSREIEKRRGTRLIGMSVGSNLVAPSHEDVLYRRSTVERCEDLWGNFEFVISRDATTHKFLQHLGVKSLLLPCTSTFMVDYLLSRGADLTPIYFTPRKRVLFTLKLDKSCFNYLSAGVANALSATWHAEVENGAYRMEISRESSYSHYSRWSVEDVVNHVRKILSFDEIVSTRIHQVSPFAHVRKCSVIPIDTRVETTDLVGVPRYPELSIVPRENKEKSFKEYVKILSS